MRAISKLVLQAAERNQTRIYHSQPQPRDYSTIAAAKRLTGASQLQLAFINAVVEKESK